MNTVQRVITIISYLAAANGHRGVTEMSKELGLSKSGVYRILSSLESAQWVVQNSGTQRYTLGSRILELSLSLLSNLDLRTASLSYLEELCSATKETAMLSGRVGLERIAVEQVPGYYEVRHLPEPGKRLPLWCGAPGKVMLAHLEESEIETVIDSLARSGVSVLASGQPVDIDRLREELGEIRRQGFAISSGERVVATNSVAAVIFGHRHRVIGAISVSGPLPRFTADLARHYGPLISQAARRISVRLGDSKQNTATDR